MKDQLIRRKIMLESIPFGPLFIMTMVAVVAFLVVSILLSIAFRQVVSTNTVHIVQSRRRTTSYGTSQAAGNVYYKWPLWVPRFGVTVVNLPVENFDVSLKDYDAYDKDRVPFMVDVVAFYRISNTAVAAQRISSFGGLKEQLRVVTQGAVRKVLASDQINSIMVDRAKFGKLFTDEVEEQLKQWGVEPVKVMELMDIRDQKDGKVIHNIQAMKTSHIEMESRTEVAKNKQTAETAEIEARQAVDVRAQEAEQKVGERTAEKEQVVGIAQQKAHQEVLDQEKETTTKKMAVKQVEQVRQADIDKEKAIVLANQEKETAVIKADGHLQAQTKDAEAIKVVGEAKGDAEKAMLLAPVKAQIELAEKIAELDGYQKYLIAIRNVEANQAIGIAQAGALEEADIKVIANSGNAIAGVQNAMDLFSTKGGTAIGGAIEAFANTPTGKALLDRLGVDTDGKKNEAQHTPVQAKGNGAAPSV